MISLTNRMTNRQFVALVRARLDAAGHRDVAIERSWIDEDTAGEPFLLQVPVGAEHVIALKPATGFFDKPASESDWHIGQFAAALVNLRAAEKSLAKYLRDMRRAAAQEIETARSEGLDMALCSVELAPTQAVHLAGRSWKDAADHVIATVTVRHTSFFLQPTTTGVVVGNLEELTDELATIKEDQRERQGRLADLAGMGADLEFDTLTLELLEEHGLDATTVLRDVWRKQCVNLTVDHLGHVAVLSLITSNGRVESLLQLDDAIWNGKHLWFVEEAMFAGHEGLVGQSLGDRVRHPVLARQPVTAVVKDPSGRELVFFGPSADCLFDADTGRIWQDERVAA